MVVDGIGAEVELSGDLGIGAAVHDEARDLELALGERFDAHAIHVARRRAAVDVLADGSISRVAVQRSDFRRLLSSGGATALIESLNRKISDLSGGALT